LKLNYGNLVIYNQHDTTTGIARVLSSAITIYPNPAGNLIYIKTEGLHPETITIYDAAGRKINTMPYAPEVDIHNVSAGVYLMEINSLEGVARKRWVKTSE
jgi:hypothetical protein